MPALNGPARVGLPGLGGDRLQFGGLRRHLPDLQICDWLHQDPGWELRSDAHDQTLWSAVASTSSC